jgi:hypothetical protein
MGLDRDIIKKRKAENGALRLVAAEMAGVGVGEDAEEDAEAVAVVATLNKLKRANTKVHFWG